MSCRGVSVGFWVLATALALVLASCGGDAPSGVPEGPGANPAAARTYRMGWFVNAPRPDTVTFVATMDSAATLSEVALIQEPVPWARLFAGESLEDLAAEKADLAGFLRALGLDVALLIDPLDGLDRTAEVPELVAAGRTLLEPDIRALHQSWVLELVGRVQPIWTGLASEINTLGQHGDSALYRVLVEMVGDLAPRVRQQSPGTEVFVTFQVEDAHGLLIPGDGPGFGLVGDFEGALDFLGLSSYPVFVFPMPADIPDTHLRAFRSVTTLPLALMEGGWGSASHGAVTTDPAEQAAFVRRYETLLDDVAARAFILLTFADLDVETFPVPPDRLEILRAFASMGVVDSDLNPKAALAAWEAVRARPRQ